MTFEEITSQISTKFPVAVTASGADPAPFIMVATEHWIKLARFLRDNARLQFDSLHCLTGVDPGGEEPFEVRYNLFSMQQRHWLEVRIAADRSDPKIPSIEQVWRIGDWFERETYDMYGIIFSGHRDLKRILLEDDWEGWPLRKDYRTPAFYRGMPVPKDKTGWA